MLASVGLWYQLLVITRGSLMGLGLGEKPLVPVTNADITPTPPRGSGTMGLLDEGYYEPKAMNLYLQGYYTPGRSEFTIVHP